MSKVASKKKTERKTPQNTSSNPAVSVEVSDAGSMDKIRDILFGNQMKEHEKRFSRMEEKLFKEIADVNESSQKRSETLEAYLKKGIGGP